MLVWVKYSPVGASALIENGSIVSNPVFNRGVSAMFSPVMTDYEIADILAFHIPAVSSAAGKVPILESYIGEDIDLNASQQRTNEWGRSCSQRISKGEIMPWLHSDIKNMAYFYINPVFDKILEKGNLK